MGVCFSCLYTTTKNNALLESNSSVNFFTFEGYNTQGKVVYVYDGDSVHVVIPMIGSNKLVKIKTRLYGIDTPELRIAEQKEKGLLAKARLIELLDETKFNVRVECGEFDKYGRVLVTLYSKNYVKSLNQILIDEGHAYEYFGKTKKKFTTL